jgi:hypothetical protein
VACSIEGKCSNNLGVLYITNLKWRRRINGYVVTKYVNTNQHEKKSGGGVLHPSFFPTAEPEFGLRSPIIDSKELVAPAYVAWRAGPTTLHRLAESIPWLLKRLQIRAQVYGQIFNDDSTVFFSPVVH